MKSPDFLSGSFRLVPNRDAEEGGGGENGLVDEGAIVVAPENRVTAAAASSASSAAHDTEGRSPLEEGSGSDGSDDDDDDAQSAAEGTSQMADRMAIWGGVSVDKPDDDTLDHTAMGDDDDDDDNDGNQLDVIVVDRDLVAQRRRRMIGLVAGAGLVLIVIFAIVGVSVSKKNAAAAEAGRSGGPASATTAGNGPTGATIPNAPQDLSFVCDPSRLNSEDETDKDECVDACKVSECCYSLHEEENTCLDNPANLRVCAGYKPCFALWKMNDVGNKPTIPMAPNDLEDVCASDHSACEKACEPSTCCAIEVKDSCLNATNLAACASYSACSALAESRPIGEEKPTIPKAPSYIGEYCSFDNLITEFGHKECKAVCDVAKCCSLKDDETCLKNRANIPVCATYEPCAALEFIPYFSEGTLEAAPTDLASTCSASNIDTADGYEACERECEVAKCCSIHHEESCLTKENTLSCSSYAPCAALKVKDMLNVTSKTIPMAPNDIHVTCHPEWIVTERGRKDCADKCEVADCCSLHNEESCLDVNNLEACRSWLPCLELRAIDMFTGGNLVKAPDNLDQICSPRNIVTQSGRRDCEEHCVAAECCDPHHESSCLTLDNMVSCQSYNPCRALTVADGEDGSYLTNDSSDGRPFDYFHDPEVPMAVSDINEICGTGRYGDKSACREECRKSECCCDDDPIKNCFLSNIVSCLSYTPYCSHEADQAFDFTFGIGDWLSGNNDDGGHSFGNWDDESTSYGFGFPHDWDNDWDSQIKDTVDNWSDWDWDTDHLLDWTDKIPSSNSYPDYWDDGQQSFLSFFGDATDMIPGDHDGTEINRECDIPEPTERDRLAERCPILSVWLGADADCRSACQKAERCFTDANCKHPNCDKYMPWCSFLNSNTLTIWI